MKKIHFALLSIVLNLFLFIIKILAGLLTNSLALTAEAFHSLSDSLASLVTLTSIHFSNKKISNKFPYGLYKLENFGALVISLFLFLTSYEIFSKALFERHSYKVNDIKIGFFVIGISVLLTLFMSFFEYKAAKRTNSPALLADSKHTLADSLGSFIVILNFIFIYLGYDYDRYFAAIVSIFIFLIALEIAKEEVFVILDMSVDEKLLNEIKNLIKEEPLVEDIKRLLVRKSGDKIFIDSVITIKTKDFIKSHKIVDSLEEKIVKHFPEAQMVFIHYEPSKEEKTLEDIKIGILLNEDKKLCKSFEKAKYLRVISNKVCEEMELNTDKEEDIAALLASMGVDVVVCGHHPNSNKAKWVLQKNDVFVWESEEENTENIIKEIKEAAF